jgi:hypothetical protein
VLFGKESIEMLFLSRMTNEASKTSQQQQHKVSNRAKTKFLARDEACRARGAKILSDVSFFYF